MYIYIYIYLISKFNFSDTSVSEIEDCFKRFLKRDDIDIILINQNVGSICALYIFHFFGEYANLQCHFRLQR